MARRLYQIGNFPTQPDYNNQYVVDASPSIATTQYISPPIEHHVVQTQYIPTQTQYIQAQPQYIITDPQPIVPPMVPPIQYVYADNNASYFNPSQRTNYVYLDDSDTEEVLEEIVVKPTPRNRYEKKVIYVDDDVDEVLVSPRYRPRSKNQFAFQEMDEIYRNPKVKNSNMIKYDYVERHDDEQPNRNRIYRPGQTQRAPAGSNRAQSLDAEPRRVERRADRRTLDWLDKWNPKKNTQMISSRNPIGSQYTMPRNKKAPPKKPNHRKELYEPTIRDWPLPNKNVIHGGAVVYK
jgi:hypothetical protein